MPFSANSSCPTKEQPDSFSMPFRESHTSESVWCDSTHGGKLQMQFFPFILQIRTIMAILQVYTLTQEGKPVLCFQMLKEKKNLSKPNDVYSDVRSCDVIPSEPSCLRACSAEADRIDVAYRTSLSVCFGDQGNVIRNGHDAHRGREKKGHCSSNNSQCSYNSHLCCRFISECL